MAPHPNAMTHDLGLILLFRNMVPCLSKPQTLSVKISSSIEEIFFLKILLVHFMPSFTLIMNLL